MKKHILMITVAFTLAILVMAAFCYVRIADKVPEGNQLIVQINEVQKLGLKGEFTEEEKTASLQAADSLTEEAGAFSKEQYLKQSRNAMIAMALLCCLFLLAVLTYIYFAMIKPFSTLEKYAGELAKGNLEISLPYERINYFGEFTWAFDHMRQEIVKARECE